MIYGAEDILARDKDVIEDQFAGIGAAHAELVEFARAGESLGCRGNNEGCDSFRAFVRLCFGVDNHGVCIWALSSIVRYE